MSLNISDLLSNLESLLDNYNFKHWIKYKALFNHIECFRKRGLETGLCTFIVQQWAKRS